MLKNARRQRIGGSVIVEPSFWPIHRTAALLYDVEQ